jgi:hypothetical protein
VVCALQALASAYTNKDMEKTLEKLQSLTSNKPPTMMMDLSVVHENTDTNQMLFILNQCIQNRQVIKFSYTNSSDEIKTVEAAGGLLWARKIIEYSISWDEVARNSGGEGFLSAFVTLSSLLSYMRRDDTDLFSDREDGKVLVMDNPFAQTNAEHMLKPLIDIAKKSNTQHICLSGLDGESIYNRFDNIYVLNLVSSQLRNGMQYLRADHKKGEGVEKVVATHMKIEDMTQIKLFYLKFGYI